MQRAKVFRNSIFAGLLTKINESEYSFVYDKEYLKLPNIKPISLTLPLQEKEFKSNHLFPFFYNLLAEGKLKDLQDYSGVNYASISDIENGKANPTIKTVEKLLDALGMQINIEVVNK